MPLVKKVDPDFQKALKKAIEDFKQKKSFLGGHRIEESALMEEIVNNDAQTSRELRDNVRKCCLLINSNWRNWLFKSPLTYYVESVLDDPKYNVEKIYEKIIDEQNNVIELQDKIITQYECNNEKLRDHLPAYTKELEKKLEFSNLMLREAAQQVEKNNKLIQSIMEKLEAREKSYQDLLKKYLEVVDKKQSGECKKEFIINDKKMSCKPP